MENSLTNYELSESTLKIEESSSNESDDFDDNLPSTVTYMRHSSGAKVYLVGTAHFSQESKDDVALVIRNVKPHIVMLELCDARIEILSLDEKTIFEAAKNINFQNILSTIKKNGVYYGISYLLLLNLSAHLTKEIGMAPGGEFRVALQEARKLSNNCLVHLGDRPIKITLMRALSKLSWWQTIKLGCHLLFTNEKISKEDVEQCKSRDMLEQLLADMSDEYPSLSEVFVDERDIYLTHSLQQAAKTDITQFSENGDDLRVVGVVGLGHTLGINRLFPIDQGPYVRNVLAIPPKTLTSKILILTFKISTFSLFGLLVYKYMRVPKFVVNSCHGVWNEITINLKKF